MVYTKIFNEKQTFNHILYPVDLTVYQNYFLLEVWNKTTNVKKDARIMILFVFSCFSSFDIWLVSHKFAAVFASISD